MNNTLIGKTFLRLGLVSFGGPTAHIGYFRDEFVKEKKWLLEDDFSSLLAICQALPGPTSSQMVFSIGLKKRGVSSCIYCAHSVQLPIRLFNDIAWAWVFTKPSLSEPNNNYRSVSCRYTCGWDGSVFNV